MIKADHNFLAEKLYRIYVSHILKSNFSKFILLNEYPDIDKGKGLILTPNHFSWWDGFFADYLMRNFTKRKAYLMMLERQLRRYWFFKYTGAFSIDTSGSGPIKESMIYAKNVSLSASDYLIFYPQGEIQPYESKFINLKNGIINLTEKSDSNVLIISFKIIYSQEKRPSIYCRFGELLSASQVNESFEDFKNLFKKNIEMIDSEIHTKQGRDLFT